jgi:Ca2+/H+ antiporter, TMEM165/GDT1 family
VVRVISDLLTAAAAALAVSVELLEALAIVLAVGISRRWQDAAIGAGAAVIVCAAIAAALAAGLLGSIPVDSLRLVIGVLLLLFGLEWLRKGTLRLAGLKARSSAQSEYEETLHELEHDPVPRNRPDWVGRAIAFKGVALEGVEIVLIVAVLASQPGSAAPALAGAALAAIATLVVGFRLHGHLAGLPETEVKWVVGVMLTSFGVFFCGEGLGIEWAGGDLALLYIAAAMALASRAQIHLIGTRAATAP